MSTKSEELVEETLDVTSVYKGRMISLEQLTVKLPNGKTSTRDIVRHPGAVGILAETADGKVLVVRQWRSPIDKVQLEIPAGKLEQAEDKRECAMRELKEETGYSCERLQEMAKFYTSPGFADEQITLFYASGLEAGESDPDEDEFLHVDVLSKAEVEELVTKGRVTDAKTLIAFQWWLLQGQTQS